MGEWVKVSEVGRIPSGQVRVIMPQGGRIALCNVDGEYFAIDDECTHDGGPLDQGEIDEDEIECPRHGARFSVRTGEALTLPAVLPVRTYPVRIDGNNILLEL